MNNYLNFAFKAWLLKSGRSLSFGLSFNRSLSGLTG